jgi:hypothetical protein
MKIILAMLVPLLVHGCAASELAKHCRKSGSESDMRCAKPVRPQQDLVRVCEKRVNTYTCYYVSRQELERAMREAQGQR